MERYYYITAQDIEVIDYCDWSDSLSWHELPGGYFTAEDFQDVIDNGRRLSVYEDITCQMLRPEDLTRTAKLTKPLPPGTKVCFIVDGYVYPLEFVSDLDLIQVD